MNLDKLKEPFPASDIEWRIGQAGKGSKGIWATTLAYISARAIMDRLDSVVGPNNWKVSYSFPNGGVICHLSIFDGSNWITKEDGAEPTEIEPFKGGISSALKRAGSAWGIGRYLYNLESEFAEISEERRAGFRRGFLKKDNLEFWWKEKALPTWALPNGEKPSPSLESEHNISNVTQETEKPKDTAKPKAAVAPESCQHNWLTSKYVDKATGEFPLYCTKCKAKRFKEVS